MLTRSAGGVVRLHSLLASPGVHILAQRNASWAERVAPGTRVTVHRLDDAPGAGVVAVRPDGYVGFRCGAAAPSQLSAWLTRIGAREPAGR